jgi:hypothetical protein
VVQFRRYFRDNGIPFPPGVSEVELCIVGHDDVAEMPFDGSESLESTHNDSPDGTVTPSISSNGTRSMHLSVHTNTTTS